MYLVVVAVEGDSAESYLSPPKRFNSGPNTPDKTGVLAQPLAHRLVKNTAPGVFLSDIKGEKG